MPSSQAASLMPTFSELKTPSILFATNRNCESELVGSLNRLIFRASSRERLFMETFIRTNVDMINTVTYWKQPESWTEFHWKRIHPQTNIDLKL
ncbi:hypothetical protein PAHAL_9G489300 [Panicum hallii]|uniref:Uncharacterized protein n=1 Tax=Panicum hallii TaxID=206008 RepID=A0A2S3IR64_9POAL|nr:hypothetical protein PAHAL_9G489300 [Panicum hallii]